MSLSRRDFLAAVAVTSAAAPGLSWARVLAPFDPEADPTIFAHGVASGDPLQDRVILWTRIEPRRSRHAVIPVRWSIARDPAFRKVVESGFFLTDAGRDFTVKVDAHGLRPVTTYYYRFHALGGNSPIGRTRTLPVGSINNLRFAVASCSNYPFGYFNAYGAIAQRADLDAVLHLGDYLYEYANGTYGDGTALGRLVEPQREMVSLDDYRLRHATYKADPDLQEAHRQHPFITVWDDHESTNDSWHGGAQNHQPDTEGDWEARKAQSIRAYYEWMPIRESREAAQPIYRHFRFGDLAELTMLDTRLLGRDQQAASPADVATINDPGRQLLGAEQEQWFLERLSRSQADGILWRLVGQQVMMAQLSLDFGRSIANADQWDGYRPARDRVYDHLRTGRIDNVVMLTGDIHSSWGNDLTPNPFDGSYNPATGNGALGVEFVAPGVTSPFLFPDTPAGAAQAAAVAQQIRAISPHIKFAELFRRGYLLLDVDRSRVQGEWYFPQTIQTRNLAEEFGGAMFTMAGISHLQPAAGPSPVRTDAPEAAP